jgi:hypothetical protein
MLQQMDSTHSYSLVNLVMPLCSFIDGSVISPQTILSVQTTFAGRVDTNLEMASAEGSISVSNTDTTDFIVASAFTVSSSNSEKGQNVIFTATTAGSNYIWDFGDGQNYSGPVASHAFDTTGSFNIALTVSNTGGCSAISNQSIIINPDSILVNSIVSIINDNDPRIWSASDKLYVDFTGFNAVNAQIIVYDFLGQEIFEEEYTDNHTYVKEIGYLPTQYLVATVRNNNKLYAKKVLIQGR